MSVMITIIINIQDDSVQIQAYTFLVFEQATNHAMLMKYEYMV